MQCINTIILFTDKTVIHYSYNVNLCITHNIMPGDCVHGSNHVTNHIMSQFSLEGISWNSYTVTASTVKIFF